MKKQTRSFLVEVKRPRLATPNAAVRRILWPELRQQAPAKPPAQLSLAFSEGLPAAVQKERRVLPDLSPIKVWHEPDALELEVQAPSPPVLERPLHTGKEKSIHKVRRPEAEAALESLEPPAASARRRKLTPWLQRSLKELPPGQRWKRHLPRCTW